EQVSGAFVSPQLFPVLGVGPRLGRSFLAEEGQFGRHRVVLLSDGLWQRRFGGNPTIVGRSITMNNEPYTVIGVMPPTFRFPSQAALWVPMAFEPDSAWNTRGNYFLTVVARLKPEVTFQQAQQEMDRVADQLRQEGLTNPRTGTRVVFLHDQLVANVRTALLVLLGATGFGLLIACVNVANLLLARGFGRMREIATRTALGASRGRVVRQLLTESALLILFGGALGILLATWGVDMMRALAPQNLPRMDEIRLDSQVLAFAFGVSLLTGVLFGVVPAWHATAGSLADWLKEGGRGGSTSRARLRLRNVLGAAEVALSVVLLVGAGLLIKSLLLLQQISPGFNPDKVLTMLVSLPEPKYPSTQPERIAAFFEDVMRRVETLPGVEAASVSSSLPLVGGWGKSVSLEGRTQPTSSDQVPIITYRQVTPRFFQVMGIPLLRGRPFNEDDHAAAPRVAIVNETFARKLFPNEDAIGKRIWLGPPESLLPADVQALGRRQGFLPFPRLTIVGVAGDVRQGGLATPPQPEVCVPHRQAAGETSRGMLLAVRTNNDPSQLVAAVRSQVWSVDPSQPVANVATMEQRLADSLAQPRFNTLLMTLFAGMAALLAAVGLYGVMAYLVSQRTPEIAIRMALGAQRREIFKLVIGHGLTLTAVGLALGLAGAVVLTRFLATLLFGVTPTDGLTFASVALLFMAVAGLACWIPARRAMRVDPMTALRYE
ncbi:MAG: ABC transporter permease, partial [Candidatus Acidiferrales bacterium]